MNKRELLRGRVENLCLLEGEFTLSTGAKSNFYFDCKRAMLDGEALSLMADVFLEQIDRLPDSPNAIGGLTMGADFIVAAVIQRAYQTGHSIEKGSIVRKKPKPHGTKNRIENELAAGTKIVVIDDVFTTGSSTDQACREFLKEHYKIVGIMALIDREASGLKNLKAKYSAPVNSIFSVGDFEDKRMLYG